MLDSHVVLIAAILPFANLYTASMYIVAVRVGAVAAIPPPAVSNTFIIGGGPGRGFTTAFITTFTSFTTFGILAGFSTLATFTCVGRVGTPLVVAATTPVVVSSISP